MCYGWFFLAYSSKLMKMPDHNEMYPLLFHVTGNICHFGRWVEKSEELYASPIRT